MDKFLNWLLTNARARDNVFATVTFIIESLRFILNNHYFSIYKSETA